jgi:hypothetical protein
MQEAADDNAVRDPVAAGGVCRRLRRDRSPRPTFLVVASAGNLSPTTVEYYAAVRTSRRRLTSPAAPAMAFAELPATGWQVRFHEWMIEMGFSNR